VQNDPIKLSRRLFLASGLAAAGSLFVGSIPAATLPQPSTIHSISYYYPLCDVATVAAWLEKIAPTLPASVELVLSVVTAPDHLAEKCRHQAGKVVLVTATISTVAEQSTKIALKNLATCPIENRCLSKCTQSGTAQKRFAADKALGPAGQRSRVEAMSSNSKIADLFVSLREHIKATPSPATAFIYTISTGPKLPTRLADGTYSRCAKLYGGPATIWAEAKDDAKNLAWHEECIEKLRPFIS
jgi:hypothetical protein